MFQVERQKPIAPCRGIVPRCAAASLSIETLSHAMPVSQRADNPEIRLVSQLAAHGATRLAMAA
jgi:hypothetical protein